MICKICNLNVKNLKSLSNHLKNHKISNGNYYETFLKKEGDGICKNLSCSNNTKLKGLLGYDTFCSKECMYSYLSTNDEINHKRKKQMIKKWKDPNSLLHSNERYKKISESLLGKKFSDERKRNISKSHIGQIAWNKEKPGCFSIETRNKMRDSQKEKRKDINSYWHSDKYKKWIELHRQKMLNGHASWMLKFMKKISKDELKLRKIVKELYSNCEFQQTVLNYSIDVAILEYKIAIEYDGYFHFDTKEHKEYHKKRQIEIEKEGWVFLRYNMYEKFPTLEQVKNDIEKLIK